MLPVSANGVLARVGVRGGAKAAAVVNAPAAAALFLVVIGILVAVATRRAGGARIVWVTLEPALHLAPYFWVCDAGGGLEVGRVDCAWDGDWLGEGRCGRIAGHAAGDTEELEKVIKLAVDITAYRDGGADGLDV